MHAFVQDVLSLSAPLVIALVFGALVGWERERKARPAGLRTHIMVALGSAGFTLVAMQMIDDFLVTPGTPLPIDPAKIIAGIVGGVGFLGAGSIFRSKDGGIEGMTTAAGIWVVASVGVASGAGYYVLSGLLVCFSLFTLQALRFVSDRIEGQAEHDKHSKHDG